MVDAGRMASWLSGQSTDRNLKLFWAACRLAEGNVPVSEALDAFASVERPDFGRGRSLAPSSPPTAPSPPVSAPRPGPSPCRRDSGRCRSRRGGPGAVMGGLSGRRWAVVAAASGTVLIGGGAFWLSFVALADLAVRSGITRNQAWIWPLLVDGLIVVATVAVVALDGHRAAWYPWVPLIAGALMSVSANAAHALVAADASVPGLLAAIVAAVPPLVPAGLHASDDGPDPLHQNPGPHADHPHPGVRIGAGGLRDRWRAGTGRTAPSAGASRAATFGHGHRGSDNAGPGRQGAGRADRA